MFGFVRQRAYLLLFVALALGTWGGYLAPPPVKLLLTSWPCFLLLALCLAVLWRCWRDKAWAIAFGVLLLVYVGYLNSAVSVALPLADPLRNFAGQQVQMQGKAASLPKYRNGHLRFMLKVAAAAQPGGGEFQPAVGQCQVYVRCEVPPAVNLGDAVTLSGSLEEIAPPRNRGQFDYRAYLHQLGTVLVLYADKPAALSFTPARASPWPAVSALQRWLMGRLQLGLPPELGGLAVSVVYGDKITDLDSATEERFRRAGLTHILVASGTQVSLLMVLLGLLGWRQAQALSWRGLLRNVLQFCGVLAVLWLYAALTGFETSILRALVMGLLVMAGRLASREVDGLTVLAQAGLVILLLNPLLLFAAGFQLSFAATFGLIYVNGVGLPRLAHLEGFKHWAALLLLSTGGAQLFVAPMLLAKFHQLSVWGMASNLIAIPLAFALLIAGGLASLGIGAIPLLGTLLTWAVWALAWLLNGVAAVFSALPGSNLAVPAPPGWWILLLYAAILTAGEWIKYNRRLGERTRLALNWGALAACLLLAAPVLAWWILPRPGLAALALEGGAAYLWRSASGRAVLIASSKRLDRSHNADTLADALRCRGVNKLHGIIWIDEAPVDDVLADWPAPQIAPGAPLPLGWDLAWLEGARQPWGLAAGLGRTQVWLAWRTPPRSKLPRFTAEAPAPALCLGSAQWWEDCPEHWRAALEAAGIEELGCAVDRWSEKQPGVEYVQNELEVRTGSHKLYISEYAPAAHR